MGQEIVYCSLCGSRIMEKDLLSGRAFTLLDKVFCADCKNQAFSQMDGTTKDPQPSKMQISGARPSAPAAPRRGPAPAPRVRPAAPPIQEQAEPEYDEPVEPDDEEPMEDEAPLPPRKKDNSQVLLIGSAVGLFLLVGLLVLVLSKQEKVKDETRKTETAKSKEAAAVENPEQKAAKKIQALEEFSATNPDPATMLAKISEAEPLVRGTSCFERLSTMRRRWEIKQEEKGATKQLEEQLAAARRMIDADGQTYSQYEEILKILQSARALAIQKAQERMADVNEMERQYVVPYEDRASAWSKSNAEYLGVLEQEKQFKAAIARIETFPKELRKSQVWKQLLKQKEDYETKLKAAGTDVKDWKYYVRIAQADIKMQGYTSARENLLAASKILPPKDRWSAEDKKGIAWNVYFNIGCLFAHEAKALEGDEKKQANDKAFEWLTKACNEDLFKTACNCHGKPTTHWEKDEDLEQIRKDPRYEALLKKYAQ